MFSAITFTNSSHPLASGEDSVIRFCLKSKKSLACRDAGTSSIVQIAEGLAFPIGDSNRHGLGHRAAPQSRHHLLRLNCFQG